MQKLCLFLCLFVFSTCSSDKKELIFEKIKQDLQYQNSVKQFSSDFNQFEELSSEIARIQSNLPEVGLIKLRPTESLIKATISELSLHKIQALKDKIKQDTDATNQYLKDFYFERKLEFVSISSMSSTDQTTNASDLSSLASAQKVISSVSSIASDDFQEDVSNCIIIKNNLDAHIKFKRAQELYCKSQHLYNSQEDILDKNADKQSLQQDKTQQSLAAIAAHTQIISNKQDQAYVQLVKVGQDAVQKELRSKQSFQDKLTKILHKQQEQVHKAQSNHKKLELRKAKNQAAQIKNQEEQKQRDQHGREKQIRAIGDSLYSAQTDMARGLSAHDKKTFKILRQDIKKLVQENQVSDDTAVAKQLAAMTQKSLQAYAQVENQGFANYLAVQVYKSANINFDMCVEQCGSVFEGVQVINKIVCPTYDEEHFQMLSMLLQNNNMFATDEQIHKVIDIEKHLLLGSFALAYKKNI